MATSAQEAFNEIWKAAAEKAAKARSGAFREASREAWRAATNSWMDEDEEGARAMRAAYSLLAGEAEKAWPMFRRRADIEPAPDLSSAEIARSSGEVGEIARLMAGDWS